MAIGLWMRAARQDSCLLHLIENPIEIPQHTLWKWHNDPIAMRETLREMRTLPKTADEARKRRKADLFEPGELAKTQSNEPLSGLVGQGLAEVMATMSSSSLPLSHHSANNLDHRKAAPVEVQEAEVVNRVGKCAAADAPAKEEAIEHETDNWATLSVLPNTPT
jgi:hypothetical protein